MPTHKPTELSRIKPKKLELNSPSLWRVSILLTWLHCRLAFAPGSGVIHVVVVNFDALAQASDIRIWRRQVVFLCWKQDSYLEVPRHLTANRLNAHSQTHWAIEDQAKNLNSTARPYDEWAFSPLDLSAVWFSHLALALYMLLLLISMLWHRQAIFESKGDKLSSSAESRIPTWKSQGT